MSMADAARKLFAADYGIAAGDLEAEEDDAETALRSPAYSVALALAGPAGGMVKTYKLPALGAAWLRERIGYTALCLLMVPCRRYPLMARHVGRLLEAR